MANSIVPPPDAEIPRHRAEIDIVWAMTAEGLPWPVPATFAARCAARGINDFQPPRLFLRPPSAASQPDGLTVAEAARQHLIDLPVPVDAEDEKRLFQAAKAKISAACNAGHIVSHGVGRDRRIDPESFAAWRLRQRDKLLRASDA